MTTKADFCPFCGNDSDDAIEGVVVMTHTRHLDLWWAFVKCQHCSACGPTYGEESRTGAIEAAVKAWNDSNRPGWWDRNITRRWVQLRYDLTLLKERVRQWIKGGHT
jgi:hypothetical protein